MEGIIRLHTIPPVFNQNSRILILGSFPSVKSRESGFFYGHPQNRFWKVLSAITGCGELPTVSLKKGFLLSHGIALWDVIGSCRIAGSSDASITEAVPNDLTEILHTADIKRIFVNGKTAAKLYAAFIQPKIGIEACVLPSTSPANASYSLERLVDEWRITAEYL